MTEAEVVDAPPDEPEGRRPTGWFEAVQSSRAAAVVFGVYVAAAFPILLFVLVPDRWFLRDEWEFLTSRTLTDAGQLFEPHYGHWTTLPIVAYRLVWAAFGIESYLPYQAMVVTLHLAVCVLLRQVMRRAGVRPWFATAVAAVLVLFGSGEQNISWAFQITMTGSVAFGLAALLAFDHDGEPGRRDLLGFGLGVGSLMCSGIGPLMVIGVSAAMLIRWGWKRALLVAVPLGAVQLVYTIVMEPEVSQWGNPTASVVSDWVRTGVGGTFLAIVGDHLVVALVLAAATVAGVVLAGVDRRTDGSWRTIGVPVGLLAIVPVLFGSASLRGWILGPQIASSSRYVYVAAVALLPAVALAAEAIARRRREAALVVLVPLAVGVPSNLRTFDDTIFAGPYAEQQEAILLSVASSPLAEEVPNWVRPDPEPTNGDGLTVDWLLDSRASGAIPDPPTVADDLAATIPLRLGIARPSDTSLAAWPPSVSEEVLASCEPVSGPKVLRPRKGERFQLLQAARLVAVDEDGQPISQPVILKPEGSSVFEVLLHDLRFRIDGVTAPGQPVICMA